MSALALLDCVGGGGWDWVGFGNPRENDLKGTLMEGRVGWGVRPLAAGRESSFLVACTPVKFH